MVALATALLLPLTQTALCDDRGSSGAQVLSLDQVVAGIVRMNELRAEALRSYQSVREYHLTLDGLVHWRAEMVAKMVYRWPDQKSFQIVSESGQAVMRNRVFRAAMDAEKEGLREGNRERSALTPDNYTFALERVEGSPPAFYVLKATPKTHNKFLVKGLLWIDAKDFAVARAECEPSQRPSWWTKKNEITYTYQKIGDFWLPSHLQSVTEVRLFGHSVLSIDYRDYELIDARKFQTRPRQRDAGPPQVSSEAGASPRISD